MGRADYLLLGDYNVVCYQCGFKRKSSTLEKNWQGYYVCPEHNEPRQTQDFVRAIPDNQIVPWSQPTPAVVYTYTNVTLGFGDGVNVLFQFGSGLAEGPDAYFLTEVKVGGTPVSGSMDPRGLITLGTPPWEEC